MEMIILLGGFRALESFSMIVVLFCVLPIILCELLPLSSRSLCFYPKSHVYNHIIYIVILYYYATLYLLLSTITTTS